MGRKTLGDPIAVLGEAYSQCQIPEVRRQIANAVCRSFTGSGIRGKDDAEFVRNAMKWYEKEKDCLTVNGRHMTLGFVPPHGEDDRNFRWMLDFETFPPLFTGPSAIPERNGGVRIGDKFREQITNGRTKQGNLCRGTTSRRLDFAG